MCKENKLYKICMLCQKVKKMYERFGLGVITKESVILRWFEHVMRMNDDFVKRVYAGRIEGGEVSQRERETNSRVSKGKREN